MVTGDCPTSGANPFWEPHKHGLAHWFCPFKWLTKEELASPLASESDRKFSMIGVQRYLLILLNPHPLESPRVPGSFKTTIQNWMKGGF